MRTFIAIDLASELKVTMEALIRNVKKNARGVKWVASPAMHLTLKFFGNTPPEKIALINDVLKEIAKNVRPFSLRLKGTGSFPPGRKRSVKVLWAGIEEEPALITFQKEIDAGFENLGFPREERPFHPHLTLGRVKFPENLETVLAELDKYQETKFGEMTVDRIALFESVLKPEGAEYSILAEVGLE